MSREGDCWYSAVAESSFVSLRTERIGDRVYPDERSVTRDVTNYIDHLCNPQRLHSTLSHMSPFE